jgi:hypothetical protein
MESIVNSRGNMESRGYSVNGIQLGSREYRLEGVYSQGNIDSREYRLKGV